MGTAAPWAEHIAGLDFLSRVEAVTGCALLVLDGALRPLLATPAVPVELAALGADRSRAGDDCPLIASVEDLASESLTGGEVGERLLAASGADWRVRAAPLASLDATTPAVLLTFEAAADTQLTKLRAEALDAIASGVIIVDARAPGLPIVHVSDTFTELTGYPREEVIGRNCRFLQGPGTDPVTVKLIRDAVREGRTLETEILNYRKDGTPFWNRLRITALRGEDGQPSYFVGVQHDITEAKLRDRASERRAQHDPLTGLPNRLLLESRLGRLIQQGEESGEGFWLLFIDLDGFKAVNDQAGHRVGDAVLVRAAERLSQVARREDTLARFGGDEFVMLLAGEPPLEAILRVADEVVTRMAEPVRLQEGTFTIGASVGLAHWPTDGNEAGDLIEAADSAMYRAKQRGRGNYTFHADRHQVRAEAHSTLREAMRTTVHDVGVVLRYEPVVDTCGRVAAAQARVRWRDAASERLLPRSVLQVAARSGELVSVAEWMFATLAEELQRWQARVPEDLRLQVGFSLEQAQDPAFLRVVEAQPGELLGRLDIELPASVADADHPVVEQLLAHLRPAGARILLADFGASPLSLQWLVEHRPLDAVKLAPDWVERIADVASVHPDLEALVALAKVADASVMAEGVRTVEQRAWLLGHGCRLMQGALWGQAVDGIDFPALLSAASDIPPGTLRSHDRSRYPQAEARPRAAP